MLLSDDAIENLMQPIIDRQEYINLWIVRRIARRIKEIGELSPSDVRSLEQLMKSGGDVREINREIARLSGLQVTAIKKLIKDVAQNIYFNAKPFYDYRHRSFIPFEKNLSLQRAVKAVQKETVNTYTNLSNSKATGFLIKDLKNPTKLVLKPINETYKIVTDRAIQAVQSGVLDYKTVMRDTVKQLSKSGVKSLFWSDTNYVQGLLPAVKRNVLDGVRAVNRKIQDLIGKIFGANGVELTAHINPAPDHAPIQGHCFTKRNWEKMQSNEPFSDIDGNNFPALDRIIGQWNCKHLHYCVVLRDYIPTYTKEELQKILDDNDKGIDINGRHLTGYECTQMQNELARKVRRAKEAQMTAMEAGDKELAKAERVRVDEATEEYIEFNKIVSRPPVNLAPRMDKLEVPGYTRKI